MTILLLSALAAAGGLVPSCPCRAHLPAPPLMAVIPQDAPDSRAVEANPKEVNLENVVQLTFGGQNAEAYWNMDGTRLTYQARLPGYPDEQIFTMNADGSGKTLVSTGKGRCTCSYFTPDEKYVYFSSTHEKNEGAQAPIDMSQGYVWMVNPEFALFRRNLATQALEKILERAGYVAETTIAPDGQFMVFTGNFEGDLDIYRADLDGQNVQRLTDEFGYDGGPFVSWDSKSIVYRRDRLATEEERQGYRDLLKKSLVRPGELDLWIMDADGQNKRQVTNIGGASFAPFLHPDGKRIVFSSNFMDPRGREFDLFIVNVDGSGLRQVTFTPEFDGFPMFTRDGKRLVWASNRFGSERGETNIFVADWVEADEALLGTTDDVWVYSHAGDQASDEYLRCWGGPTGPIGADFSETGGAFSLLRFDLGSLSEAQRAMIDAGKLAGAWLEVTHVPTSDANAANLQEFPVEVRPVAPNISERDWSFEDGQNAFPEDRVLGSWKGRDPDPTRPFRMQIDLLGGPSDFRETLKAARGGAFGLALTTAVQPSEQDQGVYKFYSRNGPEAYRPRLVLRFAD